MLTVFNSYTTIAPHPFFCGYELKEPRFKWFGALSFRAHLSHDGWWIRREKSPNVPRFDKGGGYVARNLATSKKPWAGATVDCAPALAGRSPHITNSGDIPDGRRNLSSWKICFSYYLRARPSNGIPKEFYISSSNSSSVRIRWFKWTPLS